MHASTASVSLMRICSFGTRSVGENIFGPFENGFTSTQNSILAGLGCATGKGYVQGGIDTATASSVVPFSLRSAI
jgi:hypothetical protein